MVRQRQFRARKTPNREAFRCCILSHSAIMKVHKASLLVASSFVPEFDDDIKQGGRIFFHPKTAFPSGQSSRNHAPEMSRARRESVQINKCKISFA